MLGIDTLLLRFKGFGLRFLKVRRGSVNMVNFCLSPIGVQCLVFGSSHAVIIDCEICYNRTGDLGMIGYRV